MDILLKAALENRSFQSLAYDLSSYLIDKNETTLYFFIGLNMDGIGMFWYGKTGKFF